MRNQKGFTLIELLITMAIFSVIAVISYYSLSSSFKSESIQIKHSEALFELQKTLNYIERDITQISNQNVVLSNSILEFTSLQNEQLFEIKYIFNSGQLRRIDVSNQESQPTLTLIDNISKANIRVLTNKNIWQANWRKTNDAYLKAIEVKFTHPYWGNIIKLVMLDE